MNMWRLCAGGTIAGVGVAGVVGVVGVLGVLGAVGCGVPGPVDDGQVVASTRAGLTVINGYGINGYGINGYGINGYGINSLESNGYGINGYGINGIELNGYGINGAPLDAQQQDGFKVLYQYLVECALPAGDSAVLYDPDQSGDALVYQGSLGLAPAWKTEPLDAAGEELVSACLAARTNGNGQPVLLSLRGGAIPTSPQELDVFRTYEGIFWADLFGDEPYVGSCMVEGGGLSGRVCADSATCGFDFQGDCAGVCTYDPVAGGYTSCAGHTGLIHTWLNLSNRVSHAAYNSAKVDGALRAVGWGKNDYGQLAQDPATVPFVAAPTVIADAGNVEGDIVEFYISDHSCGRERDGDVWCWGRNDKGQVGNGGGGSVHAPVKVAGDAAQIAIGTEHSCALKVDGSVWCWGINNKGQTGTGSGSPKPVPTQVQALSSGVVRISGGAASGSTTCAVKSDGSLWCWGENHHGQVGDGTKKNRSTPVIVDEDDGGHPLGAVTDVCTGALQSCARTADQRMWCWGGPSGTHGDRPTLVTAGGGDLLVAPATLTCGNEHACAVAIDSTVWCAGNNDYGQLGFDTGGAYVAEPHQVPLPGPVTFVNTAHTYTCATLVDNTVWCWGTDPGAMQGASPPLFAETLSITPQQIAITAPSIP